MLLVSFHLQRHMGNFLIQVYGPCVLLVVLSWVSFWLNREATADRVSLGITTVLTMTFLGLEARTDLPKVPYPTALDFFVFLSFAFIFATIIQFAVVHYFTKYGSGECYFSSELGSESSSDDEEAWTQMDTNKTIPDSSPSTSKRYSTALPSRLQSDFVEVIPLSACAIPMPHHRKPSQTWSSLSCLSRSESRSSFLIQKGAQENDRKPSYQSQTQPKRRKKRTPRFNSVSKIDRASRVVFPFLFIVINLFYWYSYLSRTNRIK
ncbi:unnamed protein product [Acanthoscelides obtectus]|nr:unnamed protein product [Acanthoscelides obtectus]CAK1679671.1 Gamma-aminobutyric acid receptor alpha-like [Acanthoscelides obtectus]